jgi:hypothetical protein
MLAAAHAGFARLHTPFAAVHFMISMRALYMALGVALISATATDAAAQEQRPIRAREAAVVQVADVRELVEKLRPGWLWMGGDPQYAASRAKVRVWVGGTQVGGLEALRGLGTANLHSIRLVGRRVARAHDPGLNPDVVGALLVRYESGPPRPRRFEVSAGLGLRSLLESRARQSMIDAGLDSLSQIAYWRRGFSHPATVFASAAMHLRPGVGVSASVLHTGDHNVRGIPPAPPVLGISNRFRTTDVSLGVFAAPGMLRLGAGPAVRVLRYEQALGRCECLEPEGGTRLVPGAAGDAGLVAPPTGPLRAQLRLAARWFPSHVVPANRGTPDLQLGGFTTYVTIGAGFAF